MVHLVSRTNHWSNANDKSCQTNLTIWAPARVARSPKLEAGQLGRKLDILLRILCQITSQSACSRPHAMFAKCKKPNKLDTIPFWPDKLWKSLTMSGFIRMPGNASTSWSLTNTLINYVSVPDVTQLDSHPHFILLLKYLVLLNLFFLSVLIWKHS